MLILLTIPVASLWLALCALVLALCRAAARGDDVERARAASKDRLCPRAAPGRGDRASAP